MENIELWRYGILWFSGRVSRFQRRGNRFSTSALAEEELITPPVQINYTQNLINGQFVDAASGELFYCFYFTFTCFGVIITLEYTFNHSEGFFIIWKLRLKCDKGTFYDNMEITYNESLLNMVVMFLS